MSELAGIGHNQPPPQPLGEELADETLALRARADDLAAAARERAVVASDADAEAATLLLAQLRQCRDAIDDARVRRKAPFLTAGRAVDAFFGDLTGSVVTAAAELLSRVDAWRRAKEAAAEAERRRLAAEAAEERRKAAVAENARQAAEAKARAATDAAARETARRQAAEAVWREREAADKAALLEARAVEAEAPVVISSGYGPKASARITRRVEITDLSLALRHCLKINRHRIQEAVEAIYQAQVRAGIRELPGAKIEVTTQTIVRR